MFSLTLNCYLSSSHSKIVVNFVRKRHPTFERLIHVPSELGRIGVFNLNCFKRPGFLLKKLQSGTLTCGLKEKYGRIKSQDRDFEKFEIPKIHGVIAICLW